MSEAERGYRALLQLRPARMLAIAALPADFADWLDYTAVIALLVFTYGSGPWTMAVFAVVLIIPNLVIGPALVGYIDQWPIKREQDLTNIGRALTTAYLMFAPPPFMVIAVAFLRGAIISAFAPARQAAIQATTPKHLLSEANGLHQALAKASKIAGPTIGGLLLAFVTPQVVFGVNALLSLVAMAIFMITPVMRSGSIEAPAPFLTKLVAGLGEFRSNALLMRALLFAAVAIFAFFLYDALIALLIADLGMDASHFGIAIAMAGAGGLIGGLIGGRMRMSNPLRLMVLAAFVSAVVTIGIAVLALIGFAVPAPLFLAAMALMGGSTAFMFVPYRVVIQRDVDPSRIARVFATGESVMTTAMIGAPFLGSLVASLWGVPAAFLAGGGVLLVLAVVTLLTPRANA